jgi:hypothetical protein
VAVVVGSTRQLRAGLLRHIEDVDVVAEVVEEPGAVALELEPRDHDRFGRGIRVLLARLGLRVGIGRDKGQPCAVGDHSNDDTPPFRSVSTAASPPRRSSSHTCVFPPSRLERNARYRLSGLQRGLVSALSLVVSRTGSPPATGTM